MTPAALSRLGALSRAIAVTISALVPLLLSAARAAQPSLPLVVPNDNRTPAGRLEAGVLEVLLEARQVAWQPERDPARTITVLGFAEQGKSPQIPGPLIRVMQGTELRISVRNSIDPAAHIGLPPVRQRVAGSSSIAGSELTVHGLLAGTQTDDALHVPAGETRTVRFRADRPGTYLYWGAMSRRS